MAKHGLKDHARRQTPKLTAAPKLTVVDDELVIEWPDGPRPEALVITSAGYEAMIQRINFCHKQMARDQKVVAAARKIIASAALTQPTSPAGVPSSSGSVPADTSPPDSNVGASAQAGTPDGR